MERIPKRGFVRNLGFGSGSDLEFFPRLKKIKTITAVDLLGNIQKSLKNIKKEKTSMLNWECIISKFLR
ncbi:MAG: hypothetical protein CM15mP104_4040 [Gammaproteobacteria bacterium]|nr:MAG: hypothetical protein CM15mP104_4040 [Gammaproteobacteria bacterium]